MHKKHKIVMKSFILTSLLSMSALFSFGQAEDPVIMVINGKPVLRSEFEYSYNKNNTADVIDKKTVEEYVDLFINYKLKVEAALKAGIDKEEAFNTEFATYRDQQVLPTFADEASMTTEARRIYNETKEHIGPDGLFQTSHILLQIPQRAAKDAQEKARIKADSIYNVLQKGGDFATLARQFSDDPGSKANGGQLPFLSKGQLVKEYEDAALALKVGQISKPVLSPFGYHIIRMDGRKQIEPFDSLKEDIFRFIESRGLRDKIAEENAKKIAESRGISKEELLVQRVDSISAIDSDMKYLVQEYHDGLLLYEISNRNVWDKAAKDERALNAYFAKNKKKYKWDKPRFKGMVYHVKVNSDVAAVKNAVKNVDFSKWSDVLRTKFNKDSVLRVQVVKGYFKEGDNKFVDKLVFKKNVEPKAVKNFPIDAYFGKVLKAPKEMADVRELVVADYQEELEKQWVADLRRTFSFSVNKDVLKTVNKH